jgi:hypothetical protein
MTQPRQNIHIKRLSDLKKERIRLKMEVNMQEKILYSQAIYTKNSLAQGLGRMVKTRATKWITQKFKRVLKTRRKKKLSR